MLLTECVHYFYFVAWQRLFSPPCGGSRGVNTTDHTTSISLGLSAVAQQGCGLPLSRGSGRGKKKARGPRLRMAGVRMNSGDCFSETPLCHVWSPPRLPFPFNEAHRAIKHQSSRGAQVCLSEFEKLKAGTHFNLFPFFFSYFFRLCTLELFCRAPSFVFLRE